MTRVSPDLIEALVQGAAKVCRESLSDNVSVVMGRSPTETSAENFEKAFYELKGNEKERVHILVCDSSYVFRGDTKPSPATIVAIPYLDVCIYLGKGRIASTGNHANIHRIFAAAK